MLAAVKQSGKALQAAAEHLRGDREAGRPWTDPDPSESKGLPEFELRPSQVPFLTTFLVGREAPY